MTEPAVLVIDTSVAVKWYVPEPDSPAALALLEGDATLIAPDLLGPELGNVLWKKVRQGEITAVEAREIVLAFTEAPPVRLLASAPYVPAALEIALRYGRSVYDALFLAVAIEHGGRYVTADERLVHALERTELAPTIWPYARLPRL